MVEAPTAVSWRAPSVTGETGHGLIISADLSELLSKESGARICWFKGHEGWRPSWSHGQAACPGASAGPVLPCSGGTARGWGCLLLQAFLEAASHPSRKWKLRPREGEKIAQIPASGWRPSWDPRPVAPAWAPSWEAVVSATTPPPAPSCCPGRHPLWLLSGA